MEEKKLSIREMFRINFRGLKLIYSLIPLRIPFVIVWIFSDVLISYWGYFFLARFVDDLMVHAAKEVLLMDVLFLTVGQMLLSMLHFSMQQYYFYGGSNVWEEAGACLNRKLMSMDYEYMESESIQNKYRDIDMMARNYSNGLCILFWRATPVLERTLQLLVAFFYLLQLMTRCRFLFGGNVFKQMAFLLFFISLFTVFLRISKRTNKKTARKLLALYESNVANDRKLHFYTKEYIEREECGKTIRMYHQQNILSEVVGGLLDGIYGLLFQVGRTEETRMTWLRAIKVLMSGAVYLLLGFMALSQAISVGSICMYAGCVTNFLWHFDMWNGQWVELRENTKYVKMYFDFLDIPNKKYEGTLPVEKRDDDRFMIEFRHVSFRYPNTDVDVLKDFSISFHIGERLAVVGKNGSGKTTFIKLLCRLYDPTEGEILLNGIDIRKYDYKEYLSLFSVVFQDFQIPALPVGQNVAASDSYEEEKVRNAMKRAGLAPLLEKLPQGLETPVYTDFDKNGVEISGGEAQKLAIARALYHDTPFVILDEPTASLDPLAEYEIYSRFDELVGTKTAVYISHRLSSCQFCNDILVIDGGKAVQRGNHETLVKDRTGLYYELWHTQAQYYKEHPSKE